MAWAGKKTSPFIAEWASLTIRVFLFPAFNTLDTVIRSSCGTPSAYVDLTGFETQGARLRRAYLRFGMSPRCGEHPFRDCFEVIADERYHAIGF